MIRIAICLLLALCGLAHAQTVTLNDTGQTRCYAVNQTVIPCDEANVGNSGVLPHQDARYGRDAAHVVGQLPKVGSGSAGFDFSCVLWDGTVINGPDCHLGLVANLGDSPSANPATDWACTRDNVTGLVWSLRTPEFVDWHVATSAGYAAQGHNAASRCGRSTGWRAPSRREALGLINYDRPAGSMIDMARFPGFRENCWGSEPAVLPPGTSRTEAYFVSFLGGTVTRVDLDTVVALIFGCLVHGAMPPASPSFTIHPDGTATDNGTGLMWDRCLVSAGGAPGPGLCDFMPLQSENHLPTTVVPLLQAVSALNAANHRGYSDWRIPNIKELESVVDLTLPTDPLFTFPGTAMNTTVFPNGTGFHANQGMISATQVNGTVSGTAYYRVAPQSGGVVGVSLGTTFTGFNAALRLVRGGRPPASVDLLNPPSDAIFADDFE